MVAWLTKYSKLAVGLQRSPSNLYLSSSFKVFDSNHLWVIVRIRFTESFASKTQTIVSPSVVALLCLLWRIPLIDTRFARYSISLLPLITFGALILIYPNVKINCGQHWIKDERHGATEKDSEGQPTFALVNKATGQAIGHCPKSKPVSILQVQNNASNIYCITQTQF